ncbi:MAG: DnaB-like helicase N-terminal domain-containing protein [Rhodospirillales bacterium]
MALLGAILVDNRSFERVSRILRPEHFVLSEHARVFDACGRLRCERGQIADPVTLKGWFDQDEALTQVGGPGYLIKLADCAVTPIMPATTAACCTTSISGAASSPWAKARVISSTPAPPEMRGCAGDRDQR